MKVNSIFSLAAASFALVIAAQPAQAALIAANFSGAINNGNANVKAPFNAGAFTQGQAFSGSFVYDDATLPSAGSGFQNIGFSPSVPETSAFNLVFGGYNFTLANHLDSLTAPLIQYNNGQFNGFVFIADFQFENSWYQFNVNGTGVTVKLLNGIANSFDPHGFTTGSSLINAHINNGNANVTGQTPFVPAIDPGAVPEPATWAMMIAGFGMVGGSMRRRSKVTVRYAAA